MLAMKPPPGRLVQRTWKVGVATSKCAADRQVITGRCIPGSVPSAACRAPRSGCCAVQEWVDEGTYCGECV